MKNHRLVLVTDDSSCPADQCGNGQDSRRALFQLYLLTSSVFCTRVAILSTTRFCIRLLRRVATVAEAESLPLASAGRMPDLPFGCSFQLRRLLFAFDVSSYQTAKCLSVAFTTEPHIWLLISGQQLTNSGHLCFLRKRRKQFFFSPIISI